jgi:hypothetical protein
MPVKMFHKTIDGGKLYFTVPLSRSQNDSQNVLITTSNPIIASYISEENGCEVESQPITIAKHLGEILQMDVVHLIGMSCDRHTCEVEWDVYYYVPPSSPVQTGRYILHFLGGDSSSSED